MVLPLLVSSVYGGEMVQTNEEFLGFPFLFSCQVSMEGNGSKRLRGFFRVFR